MSRTKRNKDYQHYMYKWEYIDGLYHTGNGCTVNVRVPLEGKELKKAIALQTSDVGYTNSPGKAFRSGEQRLYRRRAQVELIKFCKNPDYEVQIEANPELQYWD